MKGLELIIITIIMLVAMFLAYSIGYGQGVEEICSLVLDKGLLCY